MSKEPKEIGRFAFGIRLFRYSDGRTEWRLQSANEGVPNEIVIMQMKAFLRNLENDYFDNFDKNTAKFKKG